MSHPRRTAAFVSLGCPKNLVDSEQLVSTLLSRGFRVLRNPADADLVVVNTCGFLQASRQESLDTVREMVALKQKGVKAVLVAGCLVGEFRDLIEREAPGVDRLVPFVDYQRIDALADELLPEAAPSSFTVDRLRADASLTPGHYAYLKISEGCNHTCSFCVIPTIRGPFRSEPLEDLVARARQLAARGVRELILIAQDSTVYGSDLYGRPRLERLLDRLQEIEGLRWIRLMYAYPTEVKAGLMARLSRGGPLLPYLDVPIQHAADEMLRRMRRGYGRDDLRQMVLGLREQRPDLALRTTVMVGFPGETESHFAILLDFLREARFDRLGAFRYSREEKSSSAALEDQVPEPVKEERFRRVMSLQQEITFAANHALIGRRETVLVDAAAAGGRPALARSFRDAPEIDGGVWVADHGLGPGELVEVEITGSSGYDLIARRPEATARSTLP